LNTDPKDLNERKGVFDGVASIDACNAPLAQLALDLEEGLGVLCDSEEQVEWSTKTHEEIHQRLRSRHVTGDVTTALRL
jgi:hypothetical protein